MATLSPTMLFQEQGTVYPHGNLSFPSSFPAANYPACPNFGRSMNSRKLHLVLDLDHTLLHTTQLCSLTPAEEYVKNGTDPDVLVYENFITKLRPFVRRFLDEVSKKFELYIYTKGNRNYANRMAAFLDPRKEYFTSSSRVISCEDHGIKGRDKSLEAVVGCKHSNVMILDDTVNAWTKQSQGNLIVVDKYYFFRQNREVANCKYSHAEMKTDEYGFLAAVLELFKEINRTFCDELARNPSDVDVRDVLEMFKNNC